MQDFIKTTGLGLMQRKHIIVRSAGAAPTWLATKPIPASVKGRLLR